MINFDGVADVAAPFLYTKHIMKTSALICFIFMTCTAISQNVWTTVIGDTNKFYNASSIIENAKGQFLIAASVRGAGHGGSGDVYISKLDAAGNQLWEQSYYLHQSEFAPIIVEANDSGYLIAAQTFSYQLPDPDSSSDILLLKIDEQGNEVWKKAIAAEGVESIISAIDESGYFLAGEMGLETSQMKGPQDYYDLALIKVDNKGDEIWRRHFGSTNFDYCGRNALIQTKDSIIILGGKYNLMGPEDYGILSAYSDDGSFLWKNAITITDEHRSNSINDFMEINEKVFFHFKNAYSLEANTGKIELYQSQLRYYLNAAKFNNLSGHIVAFEYEQSPKTLFYNERFSLTEIKEETIPNTDRIFGRDLKPTSDGGYVFLYKWELDEFGQFPDKNVIRIVKTDCQGNADIWQDCTLSDDEFKEISQSNEVQVINPFSDELRITWNKSSDISFELFDMYGRIVLSEEVLQSSNLTLNTSSLNNGMYLLRSTDKETGRAVTQRIIRK